MGTQETGDRGQGTGDGEINVTLRGAGDEAAQSAVRCLWREFALIDKMREAANFPRTRNERP
jgi:hypothetical protein